MDAVAATAGRSGHADWRPRLAARMGQMATADEAIVATMPCLSDVPPFGSGETATSTVATPPVASAIRPGSAGSRTATAINT
jgi:hypothetical protein